MTLPFLGSIYLKRCINMSVSELSAKIQASKSLLQKEMVRCKINPNASSMTVREIGMRLDMIHEAERKGVRNLEENQSRKLTKMINDLEKQGLVNLN